MALLDRGVYGDARDEYQRTPLHTSKQVLCDCVQLQQLGIPPNKTAKVQKSKNQEYAYYMRSCALSEQLEKRSP